MAAKRLAILIFCWLPLSSAQAWEASHLFLAEQTQNPVFATEIGLRVAHRAEVMGDFRTLESAWKLVAKSSPDLALFARVQELGGRVERGEALTREEAEWLLKSPFRNSDLIATKGTTDPEIISRGLSGRERDPICDYLRSSGRSTSAPQAFYGSCTDHTEGAWGPKGFAPTDLSLSQRGRRLQGIVRFRTSDEAFKRVNWAKLDETERCHGQFSHAQSVFRLRRRDEAEKMHLEVAKSCTKVPDAHIRALYFVAKRRFDVGDLTASALHFEDLLERYPDRSHADDAWMYLARIARKNGEHAKEDEILKHVLATYPDGDMTFETAWEVLERHYRSGNYAEFLKRLDALELPERDNQYFSQGRLEYFAGMSAHKTGDLSRAQRSLEAAWHNYPASFYGGLSYLRLKEMGLTPPPFRLQENLPAWLDSRRLTHSGVGRLMAIGPPSWAADLAETFHQDDDHRWLKAYTAHLAGRFALSHNVVRRQISGRPWLVEPGVANRISWGITWPNPFSQKLQEAVDAESEQAKRERIHPALPVSIMREESSFIVDIESYAGALGLMQLMPRTALAHDSDIEGRATPDRLKTADVNIRVGVDHLFWLARGFDDHPVLIAAAYNAGSGALRGWLKAHPEQDIALFVEAIPPLQTRDYTKRVIGSYIAYRLLNGEEIDPRIAKAP